MKIIDLLNKIANGEIADKTKFRIYFANNMHRDIYYDDEEQNQLNCLKNVSDDYSIYDDICLLDEIEIIGETEEKKIPEKLATWFSVEATKKVEENIEYVNYNFETMYEKIKEIIDYLKSKGE